jgi:hypothetical protein
MDRELIFVYNADSGIFNSISDWSHKAFAPDTYQCNLCKVTHGNFGMYGEWRKFVRKLDIKKRFLHRNQLAGKYPHALFQYKEPAFPVILLREEQKIEPLLTADELNNLHEIESLKDALAEKLLKRAPGQTPKAAASSTRAKGKSA